MTTVLIVEIKHNVTVIRFNRPEIRSPLSVFVLDELSAILENLQTDNVIFTGQENVFASGADLREIAEVNGETAAAFANRGQDLMNLIANRNAVAAINGFCFGGALDLALACGKRFASSNAEFCHPGASLGIMTGWGGTQRLPRLVGEAAALEMFLTSKRVDAVEALRIGLIDRVSTNPLETALECLSE